MSSDSNVDELLQQLQETRSNLVILLERRDNALRKFIPVSKLNSDIADERYFIRKIKQTLLTFGVSIEDAPEDGIITVPKDVVAPNTSSPEDIKPSEEIIEIQKSLLAQYRGNLEYLLIKRSEYGFETPISIVNSIEVSREEVKRVKGILRSWDVQVADNPNDEEVPKNVTRKLRETYPAYSDYAEGSQNKQQTSLFDINDISGTAIGVNSGEIIYHFDAPLPRQINNEKRQQLRDLLRTHTSRLQILEVQQATLGIHSPPHIITEIADIQAKIAELNAQLAISSQAVDRAKLRQLQGQALKAFHRKNWGMAENLLSQILAYDQEDVDSWKKLRIAQRHLNMAALYEAIRELREENLWQAVLEALDDFTQRFPQADDTDNLREWAEEQKRLNSLWARAEIARSLGEWQRVLYGLEDIKRDSIPPKLLAILQWAEGQQTLSRYQRIIDLLEKELVSDPDNTVAKDLIQQLRSAQEKIDAKAT